MANVPVSRVTCRSRPMTKSTVCALGRCMPLLCGPLCKTMFSKPRGSFLHALRPLHRSGQPHDPPMLVNNPTECLDPFGAILGESLFPQTLFRELPIRPVHAVASACSGSSDSG